MPPKDFDDFARDWYGYGRWDAPYWFLGPEPGGTDFEKPFAAWLKLGGGELLDLKEHHLTFKEDRWHSRPYPLQPTWRRLILLLLVSEGEDFSREALKAYQATRWGAKVGKTCVIELSPIASRNMNHDKQSAELTKHRIEHIRCKIHRHKPKFVVMYGKARLSEWEQIAGGAFSGDIRRVGSTKALVAPHPQARGYTDEDWARYGRMLRD